jgi:adenylate cyclase class 2
MREVEVKYAVSTSERVAATLTAFGISLAEPIFQDDLAFAPVGWSFGDSRLGVAFGGGADGDR